VISICHILLRSKGEVDEPFFLTKQSSNVIINGTPRMGSVYTAYHAEQCGLRLPAFKVTNLNDEPLSYYRLPTALVLGNRHPEGSNTQQREVRVPSKM